MFQWLYDFFIRLIENQYNNPIMAFFGIDGKKVHFEDVEAEAEGHHVEQKQVAQ